MSTTNEISANKWAEYNQNMSNYIYGIDPNAEHGETLGSLFTNIGIIGGTTIVANKLSPYYGEFMKARKAFPNNSFKQNWSEMFNGVYNRKAELDYLNFNADGKHANLFKRQYNKRLYNRLNNYGKILPETPISAEIGLPSQREIYKQKHINKLKSAECFQKVREKIEEAKSKKLSGPALKKHLKEIENLLAKAELERMKLIKDGIIKPTTIKEKLANGIKKYSGYNAIKKTALSSKHGGKFMKGLKLLKGGFKGSGIFAALSVVCELPSIIGAFSLGSKEGFKQVGKTAVKTAAGVGGWAAGAAIGQAIIPIPGLGAVIGGLFGSWLAGKAADKIVGKKSVVEEYQEKQAKETAQQANSSKEVQAQLIQKAGEQAQQMGDEEMLTYLEEIVNIRQAEIQEIDKSSEQLLNIGNIDYPA